MLALAALAAVGAPGANPALAQRHGAEAEAAAAEVTPFQLVIARLDTLTVRASSAFALVSPDYDKGDESDGVALLYYAGSVAIGLADLNVRTGDYYLATLALVGRAHILLGEPDQAYPWLVAALREGDRLGRRDAELNGIIRDLAWMAGRRGDTATAAALAARAEACELKCGDDIVWRVVSDADRFRDAADALLGEDAATDRVWGGIVVDGERFIRSTVIPGSNRLARLLRHGTTLTGGAFLERHRRLAEAVAIFRANGVPERDLWSDRLRLADLLSQGGEIEPALAELDGLIAEMAAAASGSADAETARRLLNGAARKRVQVLAGVDRGRAAVAYRQAVDIALRGLLVPDVSAHDLRVEDLVKAGVEGAFDADTRRLAEVLLAFQPGSESLLQALLAIAGRAGDADGVARLKAELSPAADDARTRVFAQFIAEAALFAGTYPDVLPSLEWAAEEHASGSGEYIDYQFAGPVGAAAILLRQGGTGDDRIAADVLLGRFFLVRGDFGEARGYLAGAVERILATGRGDAYASTVLRDLALLERGAGNLAAAAGYEARAEACRLPCGDDLMAGFLRDLRRALRARASLSEREMAEAEDAAADAAIIATDTIFAAYPELVLTVFQTNAARFASTRPWQAIDMYQRVLEFKQARGDTDLGGPRSSLAELLLQAGEYERLVAFIDGFRAEVGDGSYALTFDRLRARALWHLQRPEARPAYAAIVAAATGETLRNAILMDLVDARYADLAAAYADLILASRPRDEPALLAKARVAADEGRFDDAAALLGGIAAPRVVTSLQRAHYLDAAGSRERAAALRASVDLDAWVSQPKGFSLDPPAVDEIIEYRDYGAYEGAAEGARRVAEDYEVTDPLRLGYRDAQILWQIAFTLARGGESARAFALMKAAAATAARISFEAAGGAGGGSLQLLRRDRSRYLLFVDIAWAWTSGVPPQRMTMSSRY